MMSILKEKDRTITRFSIDNKNLKTGNSSKGKIKKAESFQFTYLKILKVFSWQSFS